MNATETQAPLEPYGIATAIEQAWGAFLEAERRTPTPHPGYVYASAWRPCDRRMVYEMTVPDQQPPFDAFTLARFRRGNDRERDLLADLSRIGRNATPEFQVIGQQAAFKVRDRRGRDVISGKVDAFLQINRLKAPIEVKAWSPQLVDRIETFADLFESPWTRSGGYQLLSYMFGHGHPVGFMALDRSGLPKLVPVILEEHLERMEDFLAKAERAVTHAEAGTLPDFLEGDAAECQRCPFYGSTCNPPLGAKDVTVLTDPELEAELDRWNELKGAGKEWASLDARLKQRLRGVENGIAGAFSILGKYGKNTRLDLPADLKRQYTVTDPKGKFFLTIEKVVETPPPGVADQLAACLPGDATRLDGAV